MTELLVTMLIAVPLFIGAALAINYSRLRSGRRNRGAAKGCDNHAGGGCGCSAALQQKIDPHRS